MALFSGRASLPSPRRICAGSVSAPGGIRSAGTCNSSPPQKMGEPQFGMWRARVAKLEHLRRLSTGLTYADSGG